MSDNQLKYQLDDPVPAREMWIYSLQHLVYFAAGTVVLPIAAGIHLGLNQAELADFLQRTFLLSGIGSYLQVKFGHKYPIIDGPAGLWVSMIIAMAVSVTGLGGDIGQLRTDLQMGIMIAGIVIVLLAATGMINRLSRLFTPIVNGVIITLMVLQMSATLLKGVLGVTDDNHTMDLKSLLVFVVTVVTVLFVAIRLRGFIQSIATLIGVLVGWILAVIVGNTSGQPEIDQIVSIPKIWVWGTPTFDWGVTIACVLGALVLLSMYFASISSMAQVVGEKVSDKKVTRSVFIHGIITVLSGFLSIAPFMAFVSSTGVVLMTGIAAKKPFNLACLLMALFGIFTPVAAFFASMPRTIAYATSLVLFTLILGQGLKEFQRVNIGNRESYIIGISMICGVGVMFLPGDAFSVLPETLKFILSNGLVVGSILALGLEQIFRKVK